MAGTTRAGSLLRTKLFVPTVQSRLIPRPHLVEKINVGPRPGARQNLTLISAPPGYGKTHLLTAWVQHCPSPVSWISLDEGDDDFDRFISYWIAALQTIHPDFGEDIHPSSNQEDVSVNLLNAISAIPAEVALVLEDFHHIRSERIHRFVGDLLANPVDGFHLIISTRAAFPFPLARLRARAIPLRKKA